jgi:cytochrome P450
MAETKLIPHKFSSDGKKWEASRALLRPQFARDQVSDLDLEEYHVQNLMQILEPNADGWTSTIDLQVLFFRLTLDTATEFLFGESLNSQIAHLKSKTNFSTSSDTNESMFAYNFDKALSHLADGTRLAKYYWLAHTPSFRKSRDHVHKFVDHYVQLGLSQEKPISNDKKERYVFLDALVSSTRDPVVIRDELLSILLAGRDTSASLLGWTFQLFAQHPEVYEKLRATVLQEFGTYENPLNLSFTTLKSCNYLQHVLNEALRLFPVVPVNFRRCLVPYTTLPTGGGPTGLDPIYLREGDEVIYSVHAMHRSPEHWGDDAEVFRPDRWQGRKPGWEYLPFNGGPRICVRKPSFQL